MTPAEIDRLEKLAEMREALVDLFLKYRADVSKIYAARIHASQDAS